MTINQLEGGIVPVTRQPSSGDVLVRRDGAVQVIQLHRPERSNAIGGTLMQDLLWAAEAAAQDPNVEAILTTGAGRHFCVGADRAELSDAAARGPIQLDQIGVEGIGGAKGLEAISPRADRLGIGRWTERFLAIGKPTVAAINGGAGGGGLAIAMLHDVRIAAREARLSFAWAALGIGPEMGMSWILPRLLGGARAFALLTRTEPISAEEALALGLVDQVVESGELVDAGLAAARRLAGIPPLAYAELKTLLLAAPGSELEAQLEREWAAQNRLFATFPLAAG